MGLSKPLPSRYVDKMKMIPSKEKTEVTLSVTAMALIWDGVASMMVDLVVPIGLVYQLERIRRQLRASKAAADGVNMMCRPLECWSAWVTQDGRASSCYIVDA